MNFKDILEGHHIHNRYVRYWDFLLQSYEGGIDYTGAFVQNATNNVQDNTIKMYANGELVSTRVTGNLFQHPKERSQDYTDRLRMSYYYNFCSPVIDIYVNHLFKQPINEDFANIADDIGQVGEDIDMMGSSVPEFRRQLSTMAQIYGHVFVVVDAPNISDTILSRKEQIENRAFPYLSIYSPQSLVNWSLDRFGNPYWVMFCEPAEVNTDVNAYDKSRKPKLLYRLWTREMWGLYDQEGNPIAEGVHGLGVVPVVCAFDKRSGYAVNFLGVSSLADIAFIARDIYNSCSELKQILRDQTFAFLALQGDTKEYDELSIGTGKGLLYPEGRNPPAYISPPSANAETYFKHIDRQVTKIYQLAKLENGSANFDGQSAVQQSGVSKAWDFNETNSALTNKSNNLEDAEMKIWRLFALWLGKEFDGSIQYPKEFSVSKLSEDLSEAEQSAKLALGNTYQLEVLKAIQKKKFPGATEEDLDKMAKEAEAELGRQSFNNPNGAGNSLRDRLPNLFNTSTRR